MGIGTGAIYRVAYRHKGLPRLPEKTNWMPSAMLFRDPSVTGVQVVAEYKKDQHGTPYWSSSRIVVELSATDESDALRRTQGVADEIARVMEFQAGAPHVRPIVIALWDASPGIVVRTYKQWAHDLVMHPSSRLLHPPEIQIHLDSLSHQSEKNASEVQRAIKWYTDGLSEVDPLDRFLKFWVGLESIGAILNRKLHKSGWAACKRCLGDMLERTRDEKQERGMRHVFSEVDPTRPDLFDQLRVARNKLIHSEWDLKRIKAAIEPAVVTTGTVLGRSVLTALAPVGLTVSREAYEPMRVTANDADLAVVLEIRHSDRNAIGELSDFLNISASVPKSWLEGPVYACEVQLHIEGAFPPGIDIDVSTYKVEPIKAAEDGVEFKDIPGSSSLYVQNPGVTTWTKV
jgi:hypothetical protein